MDKSDIDKHDQFLRLYVQNEEALFGFVRSLVISLDDTREIMQETASVLWRKFEQLDSPDDFRRWAFGVARYEVLAFRRDKARDRHVFGDELIAMLAVEAADAGEGHSAEVEALQHCLTTLPKKQRDLVKMAYTQGMRIDAFAKSLGRTPMSVYKALHRIRMALADCINAQLRPGGASA